MNKGTQRLSEYLVHMQQAIERIARYTQGLDETSFLQNELIQDAVVRNLEILGEASNNIQKHYPEFTGQHPGLPLAFAYQMRNAVAHGYFKIDYEIVWKTIHFGLPAFSQQLESILAKDE